MPSRPPELAIVLSGGGARAAYQAGFLHYLARSVPDLGPAIITGVSAGAVNAAYLAAHEARFQEKVQQLCELWAALRVEDVFVAGAPSLASSAVRWAMRLVSGGSHSAPATKSLVDTEPLRLLLSSVLNTDSGVMEGIERNLARGELKAVALTASSYTTGQSITWVQGRDISTWERAQRKSVRARLTVAHVMASSALPLFFPAIEVDGAWYGDGGIRLTAPLSPAVHLGADRILAISTRYGRNEAEADRPAVDGYPPPAQVAGVLLNAIFLDLFDGDALRLERINRLVDQLSPAQTAPLRHVDLLVLRPSADLGRLANEFETRLPPALRFMTRGLGTQQTRSNDLLSLIMFQPDYLKHLLELGERDAEARAGEIAAFLG
jgi:NTE family protein